MKQMKVSALSVAVALAFALAMAACGGGDEPQERTISIELEGGELAGDASTWQVNQNDEVTLVVSTDEPVSFHLHGYDFEADIEPGDPATFVFTANATGSFPVTIHTAPADADGHGDGHDHDHDHDEGDAETVELELGRFEVRP